MKLPVSKSQTFSLFSFLAALNKVAGHEGTASFAGTTKDQKFALGLAHEAAHVPYSNDDLKSLVSKDAGELNAFLKQHGFSIELDATKPMDLGVVTILDLVGTWINKAEETTVKSQGVSYPAIFLQNDVTLVTNRDMDEIIKIRTTDQLVVYLGKADKPRSGLELFKHCYHQAQSMSLGEDPCEATVPMVDLVHEPDMQWLAGIRDADANLEITQALQQNKLRIDTNGIHAESATALAATRGMRARKQHVVIDGPFNIWLAYDNPEDIDFPVFTAYVAPTDWKKPAK